MSGLPQTPERERIDKFYQNMGKAVHDLRKAKNLTQEEFGQMFGMSRVAVNCIEQGKQRLSVYHYAVMCQHFNVDLCNLSTDSLPFEPKKSKLEKAVDLYEQEVMQSGLTPEQRQGAEMVFIGVRQLLIKN
jgi:transcriptional regulator with XRE-family HTH domain